MKLPEVDSWPMRSMVHRQEFIDWLQAQVPPEVDVAEQVYKIEWTTDTVNRHNQVYMKVFYYLLDEEGYKSTDGDHVASTMIVVQMTGFPWAS